MLTSQVERFPVTREKVIENAWPMRVAKGAQPHDGPRSLRSSARSLAFEDGIVVSVAAFAPAAVFVLHAFEPAPGPEEPILVHVDF